MMRLALVALGLFSGLPLLNGDTEDLGTISADIWVNTGRPANVFHLGAGTSVDLCREALAALNETATMPSMFHTYEQTVQPDGGGPRIPNRRGWFSALHTRLSVDWHPLKSWSPEQIGIERTVVDLNGDGQKEAVYRQLMTGSGSRYYFSYLLRTTDYPESETSFSLARRDAIQQDRYEDRPLPNQIFPGRAGHPRASVSINVEGYPDGLLPGRVLLTSRIEGLKEIIRIDGKEYLLVVAENHLWGLPFSVFMLRLIDNLHQQLVCRFDSRYLITQ